MDEFNVFEDFKRNLLYLLKKIVDYSTSERFLATVIILVGLFLVLRFITRFTKKLVKNKNASATGNAIIFVRDLLKLIIVVIAFTAILQVNGINMTSMIAGLGIASTVVAFSLQDVLKDVIMGVKIMYDGFFRVGEVVQIDGYRGIVMDLNLRETTLKSIEDGSTITLCNRNVSTVVHIADWIDIDVPLSYDEDVDKVNVALTATAEKIKTLDQVKNCAYLGTQDFMDSYIAYKVRLYVDPQVQLVVRRAAIQTIQRELKANNMVIPYNQLDIHQI